jgi:hypothetical protein
VTALRGNISPQQAHAAFVSCHSRLLAKSHHVSLILTLPLCRMHAVHLHRTGLRAQWMLALLIQFDMHVRVAEAPKQAHWLRITPQQSIPRRHRHMRLLLPSSLSTSLFDSQSVEPSVVERTSYFLNSCMFQTQAPSDEWHAIQAPLTHPRLLAVLLVCLIVLTRDLLQLYLFDRASHLPNMFVCLVWTRLCTAT